MKNMLNFLPVLQDLVQGHNRSYHRGIKRAPTQVTEANSPEVWENLYGKMKGKAKKLKFKVGGLLGLPNIPGSIRGAKRGAKRNTNEHLWTSSTGQPRGNSTISLENESHLRDEQSV